MNRSAFTLIEVLVSIAIIALMLGILTPSLAGARRSAMGTACGVKARQLQIANDQHASDHDAHYAPGAPRFIENLARWHGTRASGGQAFRPVGAPLEPYYEDAGGGARRCPSFEPDPETPGFERASGGYGYNNAFVGTQRRRAPGGTSGEAWLVADDTTGSPAYRFASPSATIAFADAAFPDARANELVIEYGFVEPRFNPAYPANRMDPSVHFRHGGHANTVMLDGSVRAREMTHTWSSGFYTPTAGEVSIGWPGGRDDNSLYDYD